MIFLRKEKKKKTIAIDFFPQSEWITCNVQMTTAWLVSIEFGSFLFCSQLFTKKSDGNYSTLCSLTDSSKSGLGSDSGPGTSTNDWSLLASS